MALAPPPPTSPVASLGWSMVLGCSEGSIITPPRSGGAPELPPETVGSVPTSVSSDPLAPTFAMPYMGLWGLMPVSFSDSAGNTAPLTPAVVVALALDRMPRRIAPSECHSSPSALLTKLAAPGTMFPGTPILP